MTTKPEYGEHWLDYMPALPLERGVPVLDFGINPSSPNPGVVLYARQPGEVFSEAGAGVVWDDDPGVPYECRASLLCVDLSDPQGMAYALRLLAQKAAAFSQAHPRRFDVVSPWWVTRRWVKFWQDETTDADRVAVAQALAEVAS